MPYSLGLQRDQLQDLDKRAKKAGCSKAQFIYYAIKRWKRGDFTIPEQDPGEKDIVPLAIWKKVDLKDWQVRCILRKHFETPDERLSRELERSNRICEELLKLYTGKPFIFEDKEEEKRYNEWKENRNS